MSTPARGHQVQVELALRPRTTVTAPASTLQDQVELALRSRINMTASARNSQDQVELSLQKLPLTFAVDVSRSTRGAVLRQEQNAIREICGDSMPQDLVSQSTILPWSHRAFPPMHIADVDKLSSDRGTNPGALLQNPACTSRLQDASLYAISTAGIHGTACVIILFGYPESSPSHCNVSVGMSVFAVAPHCIFLFSDVRTGIVYVLQAKGNFSDILPAEKRFLPFGEWTKWADLVTIRYGDLTRVKVPRPIKLSRDVVILPNGLHFDMKNIYTGSISEADTLDLLSDYDALDIIILAAKTRGNSDKVQNWVLESRRAIESMDNILFSPREDLGGEARGLFLALLEAIAFVGVDGSQPRPLWQAFLDPNIFSTVALIKAKLRDQHHRNWKHFESKIREAHDYSCQMKTTIEDVLERLKVLTLDEYSMSPSGLTPMSSPAPATTPSIGASRSMKKRYSPLANFKSYPYPSGSLYPSLDTDHGSTGREYLFLPGYEGSRNAAAGCTVPQNYQRCPICGKDQSIHYARHRYPMVLGNYPETDIILPLTACDACAWILLQVGELPNGGRVDAALPLVSLNKEVNRQQWVQTINRVYQYRFHDDTTLFTFLSSVCFKMEEISNDEETSPGLMNCLVWCCRIISSLPGEPSKAGLLPAPQSIPASVALQTVVAAGFCYSQTNNFLSHFLHYPIEGSVAIVRIASLIETIAPHMVELYVWKRLLYLIAEQYLALRRKYGPEEAEIPTLERFSSSYCVSVAQLGDLLPSLDQFQRLGDYFAPIERTTKYHAALAVFLHIMRKVSALFRHDLRGVEYFVYYIRRYEDQLRKANNPCCKVFDEPTLVGEGDAEKMIGYVYSLDPGE
ncbi:hypothetical protein ASPBRDRAFT_674016 [Aspergillus brasiliensis CBS 101740]|uniref:Uncharacterized protein n=1 Tax=Aspergillus brasiliensis (strain CBS 101740 / IMI 381727 / IBT 21946) TaxID=767769 RepID=A0A1L9UIP1_ASPBC|nr:hypothetical protein ASPBRDRAFT_674016 [Aspergillus brasiliensis CBS 101740]